jgi:hypothetical protein
MSAAGLAAGLGMVAVVLAGCGGDAERQVVARDRDRGVVVAAGLPDSGRFALAYRHSVYAAPAIERFRAAADGSFRLESVASPSPAVLDYYGIEGRRTRAAGWWTLRPAVPARFTTMALAATRLGRRTLVVDARRTPLYRSDGRAAHLELSVRGG